MTPKQLAEPYVLMADKPRFDITTGDCGNYDCGTCLASPSCKYLVIGPDDTRLSNYLTNYLTNYKTIVLPYIRTHHPELLI